MSSVVSASPIQEAVARIHKLLEGGKPFDDVVGKGLADAFAVLDHRSFETEADALAVLSMVHLMMRTILDANRDRVKTDGDAMLMVYAFAYLGRAADTLEQHSKAHSIAGGQMEM